MYLREESHRGVLCSSHPVEYIFHDTHWGCWLHHLAEVVYVRLVHCVQLYFSDLGAMLHILDFPCSSVGKECVCNAGDSGSILSSGRSPEKETAKLSSVLAWRIPMDRGDHGATVPGSQESDTTLLHILESEMPNIIWNSSAQGTCLFFFIYLFFSLLYINVAHGYLFQILGNNPIVLYLFCCSNCSSSAHWELNQFVPMSLWYTLIIVGLLFVFGFLALTFWHSRCILYNCFPTPGLSHFSYFFKEFLLLLLGSGLKNQGLPARCAHFASSLSQLRQQGHICMSWFIDTCISIHIFYMEPFLSMLS